VKEDALPHLCGRSLCPGHEAHDRPYLRSSFGFFEPKASPNDPHPALVREAGRQPYDTWTGDNIVFVEFRDGERAIFPGVWLRRKADEGNDEMKTLFKKSREDYERGMAEYNRRAKEEEAHRLSSWLLHKGACATHDADYRGVRKFGWMPNEAQMWRTGDEQYCDCGLAEALGLAQKIAEDRESR